jgi:tRNA pseudouridine38-40 synthase
MPRIALSLSYQGQTYSGWQTQPNGNTVQDQLEAALAIIEQGAVSTICAGRTDAGVHGLAQVVHFDSTLDRPLSAWVRGVNSHLPRSIVVNQAWVVPESFNARLSALSRTYVYLIVQHPTRQPVWEGRAGWSFRPLDLDAMREAARLFLGEQDFSALRSSQCQAATPIRTINRCEVLGDAKFIAVRVSANAFLHHMVRNLVGMLVSVGRGARSVSWVKEVLESRNRALAAPTFSAAGLYFYDVEYPAEYAVQSNQSAELLPLIDLC